MAVLPIGMSGEEAGGYQIERSLRFNTPDAAYLNRTFSTPTAGTKWTYSLWMKKCGIAGTGTNLPYLLCTAGSGAQGAIGFGWNQPDDITFVYGGFGRRYTPAVFRDYSAWYHLVFSIDTTQGTEANRAKLYVNGVQQTWTTVTNIGLNDTTQINQAVQHNIGRQTGQPYDSLNAYLAEIYFIDGSALDPTSFGEYNSDTGVWQPKAYTGSYGTNGFYLDFADNSSTTALGYDAAGSNDWTPNNFSVTAGAGNDSLVDTPTNYGTDTGVGAEVRGNYATLNPLEKYTNTPTLTNGNLTISANNGGTLSTIGLPSTGKWYFEMTVVSGGATTNNDAVGLAKLQPSFWWRVYRSGGTKDDGSTGPSYGATWTTGDTIGTAWNADTGDLTFYKNGVSQGVAYSGITEQNLHFIVYCRASTSVPTMNCNFGQLPFAYTAPSGFKALCTQNLPDPAIADGGKYFNTVLWTGDGGSTRSLTGLGFQPDFSWLKSRSQARNHTLYDAVRSAGSNKALSSSTTDPEGLGTVAGASASFGYVSSFDSDGFSVAAGSTNAAYVNVSAETYVAWNWKAGGAGVSNTAGSITSTVSANTTAGFSIVTYTGNGTAGATVGHGLGAKPSLIILKDRGAGGNNWQTYHTSLGATKRIFLNLTDAAVTTTIGWNDTEPTSSVFSLGTSGGGNGNGLNYVCYAFAPISGYSAFGSYTGNGSTDGPFVYTGFRPRWIMVKQTNASGDNWAMYDTSRSPYNICGNILFANLSDAENSGGGNNSLDILSNGFKWKTSLYNASGATYIYAAFAENPFKYSLAR